MELETKERIALLKTNYIGHLAYIAQQMPFTVPITYYYDEKNNALLCYTGEGHKLKAMRKNHAVSLEVEEIKSVNNWRSVLVQGTFEELSGIDAKYYLHEFSEGVKKVIGKKEHSDPKFISEFSDKIRSESISVVYRIKILEITGKYKES